MFHLELFSIPYKYSEVLTIFVASNLLQNEKDNNKHSKYVEILILI